MKSICVFCGSSIGNKEIYTSATHDIAKYFISNNIDLVYGGSNIGLMRILADDIQEGKCKVIGVMPHFLASKEIAHTTIDELIMVETMAIRKQKMADLSDAFIAMPGGFGTLDEISEVLTWYQLELTKKPLAIYNVNHYYDHLGLFLDRMVEDGFLRSEHRKNIIIEENPEKLFEKLLDFEPISVPHKWVDDLKKEIKK